jgi:hypothetical protein
MLSPKQIKRLPHNPCGFIPLIAPPGGAIQLAPILLPDTTKLILREEPIVEIYSLHAEAQTVLEHHLKNREDGTWGMVKPLTLDLTFRLLANVQITIARKLAASLCDLLQNIQIVAFMCNYEDEIGEVVKLISLTGKEDKRPVREFSDYLKSIKSR